MGTIYRILNTGLQVPGYSRRKVWLEVGVPAVIGSRLTITLVTVRKDGEHELYSVVRGKGVHFETPLPAATFLDVSGWAGLLALPRAAELSEFGRITRVLMEFVSVRDDVKFAT